MKASSSIKDTRMAGPSGRTGFLCEDGSLVLSILVKGAVFIIIVLLALDIISVINAYRAVDNGSDVAARAAEAEWKQSQSDPAAGDAAQSSCQRQGLTFDNYQVLNEPEHGYDVTCSKDADTRLIGHIPELKKLVHQTASGSEFDGLT